MDQHQFCSTIWPNPSTCQIYRYSPPTQIHHYRNLKRTRSQEPANSNSWERKKNQQINRTMPLTTSTTSPPQIDSGNNQSSKKTNSYPENKPWSVGTGKGRGDWGSSGWSGYLADGAEVAIGSDRDDNGGRARRRRNRNGLRGAGWWRAGCGNEGCFIAGAGMGVGGWGDWWCSWVEGDCQCHKYILTLKADSPFTVSILFFRVQSYRWACSIIWNTRTPAEKRAHLRIWEMLTFHLEKQNLELIEFCSSEAYLTTQAHWFGSISASFITMICRFSMRHIQLTNISSLFFFLKGLGVAIRLTTAQLWSFRLRWKPCRQFSAATQLWRQILQEAEEEGVFTVQPSRPTSLCLSIWSLTTEDAITIKCRR